MRLQGRLSSIPWPQDAAEAGGARRRGVASDERSLRPVVTPPGPRRLGVSQQGRTEGGWRSGDSSALTRSDPSGVGSPAPYSRSWSSRRRSSPVPSPTPLRPAARGDVGQEDRAVPSRSSVSDAVPDFSAPRGARRPGPLAGASGLAHGPRGLGRLVPALPAAPSSPRARRLDSRRSVSRSPPRSGAMAAPPPRITWSGKASRFRSRSTMPTTRWPGRSASFATPRSTGWDATGGSGASPRAKPTRGPSATRSPCLRARRRRAGQDRPSVVGPDTCGPSFPLLRKAQSFAQGVMDERTTTRPSAARRATGSAPIGQ